MRNVNADFLKSEGISPEHTRSFQTVAQAKDCVVMTRTPGKAALGLLAEGYDAKGFHVKGKSCSWGPWAGFICVEPRFNKDGLRGAASNMEAHLKSLTNDFEALQNAWRAKNNKPVEPVFSTLQAVRVSDARVRWLSEQGTVSWDGQATELRGQVELPRADGFKIGWLMRRDATSGLWSLYYSAQGLPPLEADAAKLAKFTDAVSRARDDSPDVEGLTPVFALTNPFPPYPSLKHKNAITGDFDLFAVWPRKGQEDDFTVRVAGMREDISKKDIYAAEESDLIGSVSGNISTGVYEIAMLLNMETQKLPNQDAVNRVFHSDEGGRPGMDEVDDAVAFMPTGEVHFLSNKGADLAELAFECATAASGRDFAILLNTGWKAPMRAALGDTRWAKIQGLLLDQNPQPAPKP